MENEEFVNWRTVSFKDEDFLAENIDTLKEKVNIIFIRTYIEGVGCDYRGVSHEQLIIVASMLREIKRNQRKGK